jgi:hypothetical protein
MGNLSGSWLKTTLYLGTSWCDYLPTSSQWLNFFVPSVMYFMCILCFWSLVCQDVTRRRMMIAEVISRFT